MKKLIVLNTLLISFFVFADIHLPSVFSDNMVLLRNSEVVIWGNATPNEEITLKADFLGKEYKTKADSDAKFKFVVPTGKEGGPYSIQLNGYNEVVLKNIMLGEVWLLSGQSNMEMTAGWGIKDGEKEVEEANYPNIRFFTVPKLSALFPQDNLFGKWEQCSPETMRNFSAIGYFFGRKLHKELKGVPIGLISSSWGGSAAELWTPSQVFDVSPDLKANFKKLSESEYYPSEVSSAYNAMIHPLHNYAIRGVLWYQGETNTGNPETYEKLVSLMIGSWRENWGSDFPFYIAQISGYNSWGDSTVRIQDAQRRIVKNTPNTRMVVTADLDVADDIHPKNKKPVGERFADLSLKNIYKQKEALVESPEINEILYQGNKVIIRLNNADGLYSKNRNSQLFEIAGNDGNFFPAKATIKSNEIILQSKEVRNPTKVRYAWSNTARLDIFNMNHLPLSSFTTELIN